MKLGEELVFSQKKKKMFIIVSGKEQSNFVLIQSTYLSSLTLKEAQREKFPNLGTSTSAIGPTNLQPASILQKSLLCWRPGGSTALVLWHHIPRAAQWDGWRRQAACGQGSYWNCFSNTPVPLAGCSKSGKVLSVQGLFARLWCRGSRATPSAFLSCMEIERKSMLELRNSPINSSKSNAMDNMGKFPLITRSVQIVRKANSSVSLL